MQKFLLTLLITLMSFSLFAEEKKEKWISMFNGKDLTGWEVFVRGQKSLEDSQKYFQVHEGNMHFYKDVDPNEKVEWAVVQNKIDYSHYKLRFEYKWGEKRFAPRKTVKRDSGLLIHCHEKDREKWRSKAWPISIECQIQETDVGDLHLVGTKATVNVCGELFKRDKGEFPRFSRSSGQKLERVKRVLAEHQYDELYKWNKIEAIVTGTTAAFYCNENLVMEVTDMKKPVGESWVPLSQGKIALQCEGAEVMYRNIEILPLSKDINNKKDLTKK